MEEAPFSFTTKVNGDLLTVRGKDYDEFYTNVLALNGDTELIGYLAALQAKAHGQANARPAATNENAAAVAVASAILGATEQSPGSTGQTFTCEHGARVERSNKPGAAKKWTAYFCPTQAPGCKPMNADGTLWK